tara:strand:- start:623 stop:1513 length:891 start_codon:yes stop_codon:yes gene_type:complete
MARTVGAADLRKRKRRSFDDIRAEARRQLAKQLLAEEHEIAEELTPAVDQLKPMVEHAEEEKVEEKPAVKDDPSDPEWMIPSHMVVCGTVESGKTVAARYMVRKNLDKFDSVVVVCGNKHEGEWGDVVEEDNMFEMASAAMLQRLMEHCIETGASVCLVLDDPIGMEEKHGWNPQRCSKLAKIATSGRHQGGGGISVVYICQTLMRVPNMLRYNSKYFLLGNLPEAQIEAAAKEIADPILGQKGFKQAMISVAKKAKEHKFFVVDNRERRTRIWSVPQKGVTYVGSNTAQHEEFKS